MNKRDYLNWLRQKNELNKQEGDNNPESDSTEKINGDYPVNQEPVRINRIINDRYDSQPQVKSGTLNSGNRKLSNKGLYRRYFNFKNKKPLKILGIIFLIISALIFISLVILYFRLPAVDDITQSNHNSGAQILDSSNRVLGKIDNQENRIYIPISKIPAHVQKAVIAMEDERFYKHHGIDYKAITRSALSLIDPSGKMVKGGGSTITQQLAKNLYLNSDRNLSRKIKEALLAIKIENKYPKEKILEAYLNEVYWGSNAYGIEAAAKTYFGKSASRLNLAEATLISGILSAPEAYSPYKSMKLAKWRQSLTLNNMLANKFISSMENKQAKTAHITLTNKMVNKTSNFIAPYFTSYVISLLNKKFDDSKLNNSGLKVYTTLDPKAQEAAEIIIRNSVRFLGKYNVNQGALVSVDPNTGYIKSLVGGTNYQKSQYNRITQAQRQPGSSFKPMVYLTAFNQKIITPDSPVNDAPVSFTSYGKTFSPKNYAGDYRGKITVKEAIKYSVNTVAVQTLQKTGIDKVISTSVKLGISSKLTDTLSLALGASEVSPLELVSAYSVFATGGKKVKEITPILKITDQDGKVLEDNSQPQAEKVFELAPVKMLNDSLREVVSPGGTGHAAMLADGRPVAGKTGTTSNNKDAWFIGYIPQLVTLVWAGNDNNAVMQGATGGTTGAPIWKGYMTLVTRGMPIMNFPGDGDFVKPVTNNINKVPAINKVQVISPVVNKPVSIKRITPVKVPKKINRNINKKINKPVSKRPAVRPAKKSNIKAARKASAARAKRITKANKAANKSIKKQNKRGGKHRKNKG